MMGLTADQKNRVNRMCPAAQQVGLGDRIHEAAHIQTVEIDDLAVTTGKLAAKAVTQGKIGDKAVGTGQINDGAVTTTQLGAKAVETGNINDAAVSLTKLDATTAAGLVYEMVVDTGQSVRAGRLVRATTDGKLRETTYLLQDAFGIALADGAATETVQVLVTGVREVPAQRGISGGQYVKGGHEGAAIAACLSTTTTVATGTGGDFSNQPAGDTVDVVSDDVGDTTQTLTLFGTDNADAYQEEEYALNGTSSVAGAKTFKNVCGAILDAPCAGTVTISENSGSLTITTIAPAATGAGLATVNNDGQAYNQQLTVSTENTEFAIVQGIDHEDNAVNEVITGSGGTDTTTAYLAEVTRFLIGQCAAATRALTATEDPDRRLIGVCLNAPSAGDSALVKLR